MSKIKKNLASSLEESRQKKEGYNWIGTLKSHGIISGFLAIISIIFFIGFLISDDYFGPSDVVDILSIILPISFILFIISAELYISAISFDMYNLSIDIKESLMKKCENKRLNWEDFVNKQLTICKKKKKHASMLSNIGLLLLFIAFLFITPDGYGFFILFAGIGYLIWQYLSE
jgi:hypothetical protein